MSATLVDAIVRVVGELGSRPTIVSVIKSGSFIRSCVLELALLLSAVFPNDAPVFCARSGNQPVSAV